MKKLLLAWFLFASSGQAGEWSYENRRSLSSDAMQYFGMTQDNSLQEKKTFRVYNFSTKASLLGDCGNLNVRTSFKSIYAEANRLFSDLKEAAIGSADSIARAAPMLALCYFSPTACSIAKNLQLFASYSAKLKFDQCEAINKYVSTQAGIYKEQQADCLRKKIAASGNISEAVESCKSSADKLASWVDGSRYTNASSNHLIKSTALWAGIPDREADILAALVGGVEYESNGHVRITYGSYSPLTPGRLFDYYTKSAYRKLCGNKGLLQRWQNRKSSSLSDSEYFQSQGKPLLSHHLMDALSRLPMGEREAACDRLSTAMSVTKFVDEMEERFDQLYVMAQNPYLPESEKERLEHKTKKLIEHTLAVLRIKNLKQDTLNSVRANILSVASKVTAFQGHRAVNLNKPNKFETPLSECDDFSCGGN